MSTIETIRWEYDPQEYEKWKGGERHKMGFPKGKNLMYCSSDTGEITTAKRPHYFGEAWVCRHFYNQGYEVFHERFWLEDFSTESVRTYNNPSIKKILGEVKCQELERSAIPILESGDAFGNPDVIAYHPTTTRLHFLEVKLNEDTLAKHQEESLKIIKSVLPDAQVAVVELAPIK